MTKTSKPHGITLYGIKNCDTVRKARHWLDSHAITYRYHDFRDDGLTLDTIDQWLARSTAGQLLNKRSTTWKQLDDATRNQLDDDAIPALLAAHPTLVKRPVLDTGGELTVGFSDTAWQQLLL
ncbi:MAG: arsenate reductase [Porticoccaceae bacterium]